MFISTLDLFKIGIGPSSSHTMGPMVAARDFRLQVEEYLSRSDITATPSIRCTLKGSLSATGRGHATDRAVTLGMHGYSPVDVAQENLETLVNHLWDRTRITPDNGQEILFSPQRDILFDPGPPLTEHPNGMTFELLDGQGKILLSQTSFSIGGGFVRTLEEMHGGASPGMTKPDPRVPFGFDSAAVMLEMAAKSGLSIAEMKRQNELATRTEPELDAGLDQIWNAMRRCTEQGLEAGGTLPGGLNTPRRAKHLIQRLRAAPAGGNPNDWLCAYAMAVNEENAAGHMVVTAPTNGAAGVIPATLYHFVEHQGGTRDQVRTFLLTASAIGGLVKHRSSISGAEVGCQGEVGTAAAMAAAGLCAVRGGTPGQVEHAAEIALEHHLGMTCDPVHGLVQVPCIERNAFGAIKAAAAASLALHGSGDHLMSLDQCIAAMKQTGEEMSVKFKETSTGGLAVAMIEC